MTFLHGTPIYLSGVYLSGANLRDVNLFETIFDEDQVNLLCEKYDLMDIFPVP